MYIATKGRNALKVMIDLAQRYDEEGYISLTDIAMRVKESQKYLEATVSALSAAGLVVSARGKLGGYKLSRAPRDITVAEIIACAEGSLAPVSCLDGVNRCEKAGSCLTLPLWKELDEVIVGFLNSKSLADLIK